MADLATGRRHPQSAAARRADQSYFESYAGFGIHQEMISDKVQAVLGPPFCFAIQLNSLR